MRIPVDKIIRRISDLKHTNYKRAGNNLQRIANKVLTQDDLSKQIIIQKGNTYQAFDQYVIEETEFGWHVISDTLPAPLLFNTSKVALAWCIAYKVDRLELSSNMLWLDNMIATKQIDIDILTHILDNDNEFDNRTMLVARLMEDINSRQTYKKQLSKCVNLAKQIHLAKYKHGQQRRKKHRKL